MTLRFLYGLLLAALMATPAFAHVAVGDTNGFAHGVMHPLGGVDHVLVMVAVGLFAARLGGRALWAVPAAFVAMMAAGGALGMAGIAVPFVEVGIALSVIALGLAVALRRDMPVALAMALVGFFAVFHGHAHGAEMPASASGLAYGAGFILATAALHLSGIGAGIAIARLGRYRAQRLARIAGSVMVLAGAAMLGGLM
jgi:urease accessory protein